MPYPSTISVLPTPQPTDRLNNPSHSSLHASVNGAIVEIETFVGTDSSVAGSLAYDIRSPDSNGGGHVQTANKGGTGQTSFNKGDLLVGQSSSVLAKLSAGLAGQILQVNSSVATGLSWVVNSSPKISTSASVITVINNSTETSILSVTIPASTLSVSNAIRATVFFSYIGTNQVSDSLLIKGTYGNSVIGQIAVSSVNATLNNSVIGTIEMEIIAANSQSAQRGFLQTDLFAVRSPYDQSSSFVGMKSMVVTPLLVDSGANQTLGITAKWNNTSGSNRFDTGGYIVEKIT